MCQLCVKLTGEDLFRVWYSGVGGGDGECTNFRTLLRHPAAAA